MSELFYLETPRTMLRNLTSEDAQSFYQLNLDPEVLQYTGDQPFSSVEAAKTFLAGYDQYANYRVGRFAVIAKATAEFLGWCGLRYTPETGEYDIGFRFFRRYWNLGYATETAAVCLHYGFATLNIPEIVGRAMLANTASLAVLEKIGMRCQQATDFSGHAGRTYRLTKADYEIQHRKTY